MQRSNGSTEHGNAGLFWPVLCLIAAVDFGTKYLAAKRLLPQGLPHEVFGDWVRFTLVRNPGAAFGLHLGSQSRWIFMALTIVALVILGFLYTSTRRGDAVRSIALAMVCGGAVGNLIDRITSPIRRGGLHRHRLRRFAMADLQRRRHGREHRRLSARLGLVG